MSEKVISLPVVYEVEGLGSFTVDVGPITRKQIEMLGRKHRTTKYGKNHQQEVDIDREKYYPDLYSRILFGWSGLTEELKSVICFEQLNGVDPTAEVPYKLSTGIYMARTSQKFADFIEQAALNFDVILATHVASKKGVSLKDRPDQEQIEKDLMDIETKNS